MHDAQPRSEGVTAKNEFALTITTSPGTQCLREISSVLDNFHEQMIADINTEFRDFAPPCNNHCS